MSAVTVCGPAGRYRTVVDRLDGERRWCFGCRARRDFRFVVKAPTVLDDMWYGYKAGVFCCTCNLRDGDLFPGRFREWDD